MIPFGKILKFKSYDAAQLERMKNDLGLQAPLSLWQYCVGYYGKSLKRDPYIEELKLLDRLFEAWQALPALISVQELYTNDDAVAETYGDMMQKRKELSGGAQVFLGELLGLADAYLQRAGKRVSYPQAFWEDGSTLSMIPASSLAKKKDDLFALVLPAPIVAPAEEVTEGDFEEGVLEEELPRILQAPDRMGLWADPTFTAEIKALLPIRGGILTTLLQEQDAFTLELSALCAQGKPCFAETLIGAHEGALMIRISATAEEPLNALAKEYGYTVKPVAYPDEGGEMTVLFEKKEIFRLETAFLKTLFPQKILRARLKNEADGALAQKSLSVLSAPEGFSAVKAFCAPAGAFFTNALSTALDAVILQAWNGTAYWEQHLWISLQAPKKIDDHTGGDLLSAMIGLYRLQAELGIPASTRTVYDENVSAPVLTVVACGKSDAPTQDAQALLQRLNATKLPLEENGLPRFEDLRELLKSISSKKPDEASQNAQFMETEGQKEDAV